MRVRALAAGVVLAASMAACSSGSHSSASAKVSSLAANPTVSSDVHAAGTLLRNCAKAHPTIVGTRACVAAAVPRSTRSTVAKCLGNVYVADVEHATAKGAKARAEQAWSVFTTSSIPGYSGNLCLPANLR